MGCCESRPSEQYPEGRRIQDRRISLGVSNLLDAVEENDGSLNKTAHNLVLYAREEKFDKIFSLISSSQRLNPMDLQILEIENLPSKTIGSLSIYILLLIAKEDALVILQSLIRNIHIVMSMLQSKEQYKDSLVELLHQFTSPKYEIIKEQLLRIDCFTTFVPIFAAKNRETRIQIAEICDYIYLKSTSAQAAFFQNKGEVALIQLIVREGEEEDTLLELLDFMYDLMIDENSQVNSYSVQKIRDSNFHDHILTLNVPYVILIQKSIAAIEKVDKIICEFPFH